jgi:hypothetical protein
MLPFPTPRTAGGWKGIGSDDPRFPDTQLLELDELRSFVKRKADQGCN